MPSLLWRTDLDGENVIPAEGFFVTGGGEIAVATNRRLLVFIPVDGEYRRFSELDPGTAITGITAGRPGLSGENREDIVVSTAQRILLVGVRNGVLGILARTGPETGVEFADVAAGDLDRDGQYEIVAASPAQESIYVYRATGGAGTAPGIEPVGIRAIPGRPLFVDVVAGTGGRTAIAVAYRTGTGSGVALFYLTETGFEAGPVLEPLPFAVSALAAGNFSERTGSELALGGAGGTVWLVGVGDRLEVLTITDSLGTAVSSLARRETGPSRLIAGTPEGNVFVFNYPAGRSPNLAFNAGERITGLAQLTGDRVAAGTAAGGLQVWLLSSGSGSQRGYIVKSGDTLWVIAGRFGVTVDSILAINDNITDPDVITPGQIIKIPVR